MATTPTRSKKRTMQLRLLLAAFGLLFALLAAELVLQVAPGLLPASFRSKYPPHGIELFHPGLLDRTPIQEVPLPYGVDPYDGPPPNDLILLGIAPPRANATDREQTTRLTLPADGNGLPNEPAFDTSQPRAADAPNPDIVMVGDSFTLYAGQRNPPGLQSALETAFDARIVNLAISGLGPIRERFLLEHLGLPQKPRLVIWFFFGGNDIANAMLLDITEKQGADTYAKVWPDRRAPTLILPSMIASWFTAPRNEHLVPEPLPPLHLKEPHARELWLHPDVLRMISVPETMIRPNAGWTRTREAILAAKAATERAGAEFLFVYLPPKAQIAVPLLTDDAELLYRYASSSTMTFIPIAKDAATFAAGVRKTRSTMERMVAALCRQSGIRYWSATPAMAAAAKDGEQLYYTADTHWNTNGQRVTAEALIPHMRSEGLLK